MLFRGNSFACNWFFAVRFLHIFEHKFLRVLVLYLGDQGIAIHVLPLADISGLEGSQYEHRQNVEELLKNGIRPGLDRQ